MKSRHLAGIALAGLFFIGATFGSLAQQQNKQANRPQHRKMTMRMADKLNLSQDQRNRINGILESARSERQVIMQSNRTQEQKRADLMALRTRTKQRISAVLTPEQRQKAQAMRQDSTRNRWRHKERIFAQLGLTEIQKAQIREITQGARAEAQRIRQSNRTDEQKRIALRDLHQQTHTRINNILTPEQRQKATELMKQHRSKWGKQTNPSAKP